MITQQQSGESVVPSVALSHPGSTIGPENAQPCSPSALDGATVHSAGAPPPSGLASSAASLLPTQPGPAKPPALRIDSVIGKIPVLSEADQMRFMTLEYSIKDSIAQGWRAFVDIGSALTEIQRDELYASEFSSFEEYCRVKWDFQHSKAHNFIAAAAVVKSISALGNVPIPERESPLRPLYKLSPEAVQQAWKLAVEQTGGRRITARVVQKAVEQLGLAEKPAKALPKREGMDRNRRISDCFSDLLQLLSQRAAYETVISKVEELHGLVGPLLTKRR